MQVVKDFEIDSEGKPLRTKFDKEKLKDLPIYRLTCIQFSWIYPDRLNQEHFKEVKNALKAGLDTYDTVYIEYPILRKKVRK